MAEDRQLTYRAAVIEALGEEMRRDPRVILIGEDIGAAGGVFKQTEGLFAEFGKDRIIDTPISEPGAFGIAVGAAMTGMRPVFEVMFNDFMTLIMDQLVNQAAKIHYMSNGQYSVPLVIRTTMGSGASLGPQHSQSLYAWAAHVPGLKICLPSSPADAKGLFKSAIRDDNPVLIFEDRLLYGMKGKLPENEQLIPLGRANIKRPGRDITAVATGRMVATVIAAANRLISDDIDVEVIDVRSLVPLDVQTMVESVKRTNRVVVVDGGCRQYGAAGELAATLAEQAFDWLDGPVTRLAAEDIPIPASRELEALIQPDEDRIVAHIKDVVGGGVSDHAKRVSHSCGGESLLIGGGFAGPGQRCAAEITDGVILVEKAYVSRSAES